MPSCKTAHAALITPELVLEGAVPQYALAPALGANTKDLYRFVIDERISPADRNAQVAMAALTNDRHQYRRFGTTTLALYTQNADDQGTSEQVLIRGCKAYIDSIVSTVFANEVFDSVYEQWIQNWEEKATYTFEQWKRERGTILAIKGLLLEPTIEVSGSFTELFDIEKLTMG